MITTVCILSSEQKPIYSYKEKTLSSTILFVTFIFIFHPHLCPY